MNQHSKKWNVDSVSDPQGSKSPTIGIYNSNISCQSCVGKIKHQNVYANLKNFNLVHKMYEGQNRPQLAIYTRYKLPIGGQK